MNAKQGIFRLWALVMILALAGACAAPAGLASVPAVTRAPSAKTLYLVTILREHPLVRLMTLGFLHGCQELGYQCKTLQFEGSEMAVLVAALEQAVAEKADGIVTWALDPALKPALEQARQAGIPVISAHFAAASGDYPLTAWVAVDTEKYAQDMAVAMGTELRRRGVQGGTIVMTQGTYNAVEDQISMTFAAKMRETFPEYKVLPAEEEGFDAAAAQAKAAAILQVNPGLVGAMSTTAAGAVTWAASAAAAGKPAGEIVILGLDYTRPNLDLVKTGQVFGLVGQPVYQEHHDAVFLLDRFLRGEKVSYANALVAPIITANSLDPYYALNEAADAALGVGATPAP